MNPGSLQDRVVAVIGGTGGLGLGAARACAAAGARVALLGHRPEEAEAATAAFPAGQVLLREGDAREPGVAEALLEEAVAVWSRFDGLVHVAGGSGRSLGDGPLEQVTDDVQLLELMDKPVWLVEGGRHTGRERSRRSRHRHVTRRRRPRRVPKDQLHDRKDGG